MQRLRHFRILLVQALQQTRKSNDETWQSPHLATPSHSPLSNAPEVSFEIRVKDEGSLIQTLSSVTSPFWIKPTCTNRVCIKSTLPYRLIHFYEGTTVHFIPIKSNRG